MTDLPTPRPTPFNLLVYTHTHTYVHRRRWMRRRCLSESPRSRVWWYVLSLVASSFSLSPLPPFLARAHTHTHSLARSLSLPPSLSPSLSLVCYITACNSPLSLPREALSSPTMLFSWQGATKKAERFSAQFYTLNWLERQGAGWTGEGACVALWQPRPGAPKIATLLLDDLAFFTNVRCKADVKLDSSMKVEMSRCLSMGARARQQGRQTGRGVVGRGR